MQNERLMNVVLHQTHQRNWSQMVREEYEAAVRDMLQENYFHLCKNVEQKQIVGPYEARGPYHLHIFIRENRLFFDVRLVTLHNEQMVETSQEQRTLPMTIFKRVIKDYFLICDSYLDARREGNLYKLEPIDMARRGVHNDGAMILMERLKPDIDVDLPTARRLFTLICVLHIR
jgi:uncharacterized protein (UPF0262 family)